MTAISGARIDHVALRIPRLAWHVDLFGAAFAMTVTAEDTGNPRQVWLDGGLQLIERDTTPAAAGILAHVAIGVEEPARVAAALARRGCMQLQRGPRWWSLGDELVIELVDSAP